MRSIFLSFLMFVSILSFAGWAQAQSLKENMKSADKLVKQIKLTAADASKNAENASLAAQIPPIFRATLSQTPEFVQSLPANQQAAAVQEYQNMIHQVIDLMTQLQQAFESNDNAQAQAILKKINELKSDGHERFDP